MTEHGHPCNDPVECPGGHIGYRSRRVTTGQASPDDDSKDRRSGERQQHPHPESQNVCRKRQQHAGNDHEERQHQRVHHAIEHDHRQGRRGREPLPPREDVGPRPLAEFEGKQHVADDPHQLRLQRTPHRDAADRADDDAQSGRVNDDADQVDDGGDDGPSPRHRGERAADGGWIGSSDGNGGGDEDNYEENEPEASGHEAAGRLKPAPTAG